MWVSRHNCSNAFDRHPHAPGTPAQKNEIKKQMRERDGHLPKPRRLKRRSNSVSNSFIKTFSLSITERLTESGMMQRRGEWTKKRDKDGYNYYYNNKTNECQWESPFPYQKIPLPWSLQVKQGCRMYINSKTGQELEEGHADTGDVYYYDHATGKSQWEKVMCV